MPSRADLLLVSERSATLAVRFRLESVRFAVSLALLAAPFLVSDHCLPTRSRGAGQVCGVVSVKLDYTIISSGGALFM